MLTSLLFFTAAATAATTTPTLDTTVSTDSGNISLGAVIEGDSNNVLRPRVDVSLKVPRLSLGSLTDVNAFDTLTGSHLSANIGGGFASSAIGLLVGDISAEAALGFEEQEADVVPEFGLGVDSFFQFRRNIAPQLRGSWSQEVDESGERAASAQGAAGVIGLFGTGGGSALGLGGRYNVAKDLADPSLPLDWRAELWVFAFPSIAGQPNVRLGVAGTYSSDEQPYGVMFGVSYDGKQQPLRFE